jgi:3-oxoacyl-[acyl-carrier-protein] synthase II
MGAVSPNGIGRDAYWKNTSKGVSGTGPITLFDSSKLSCKVAAEVKDFDFDRHNKKTGSRPARADAFATDEAAADEDHPGLSAEHGNIGVVGHQVRDRVCGTPVQTVLRSPIPTPPISGQSVLIVASSFGMSQ